LNAPWGVVAAPSTFGQFANDILVGNFGDGTINAFSTSGTFVGQLTNASNAPLLNPGLWDIVFGGGGVSGDPGTLFLTAGGSAPVFASVLPAASVASGNFTLSLSAQSVNVTPGGSVNVTVSAAAVGGFNSQISLSCSTNRFYIDPLSSTSAAADHRLPRCVAFAWPRPLRTGSRRPEEVRRAQAHPRNEGVGTCLLCRHAFAVCSRMRWRQQHFSHTTDFRVSGNRDRHRHIWVNHSVQLLDS
jgi:hypothetical protein